jgi:hypothetical protein
MWQLRSKSHSSVAAVYEPVNKLAGAERSKKYGEASDYREDGVVFRSTQEGKPPRLRHRRRLRDIFLYGADTPPFFRLRAIALALRGGDARRGIATLRFIHSLYDRRCPAGVLLSVLLCLSISVRTFSHETLTTTVLFDREIVRILNNHCVMCHFEDGPSFPLETYEQTWLQGRKIRSAVIARHMPPWSAVPGYGQFANDNSLTLRETQFIVSWVEGLGPRNSGTVFTNVIDASGKPRAAVRATPEFTHWQLGQPDLALQLEPISIAANEANRVKQVVIDPGLKTARRLRALEYMPGDRRVVRAAAFSIQETGQRIGAWTPWYGFMQLPGGVAFQLPAGAHIVAEIHYKGAKDAVVYRSTLGLFFTDKPGANMISDLVLGAQDAGKDRRFRGETRLTADTRIVALHLELQGAKSVEVSARRSDGGTDVLLFAKDFQNDWPTPYIFKQPVLLRRGAVLSITSYGGAAKAVVNRY